MPLLLRSTLRVDRRLFKFLLIYTNIIFLLKYTNRYEILSGVIVVGVIAQLVERYNGIVEVKGSTPFGSTILIWQNRTFSSAVEHYLHTVGVASSILAMSTRYA